MPIFRFPSYFFYHVSEDEGRAWNGSADALLRMDKEDHSMGSRGGHSGIPVHFSGATSRAHSESLAGVDSSPGFRALPRVGLPLPCQTFPACRNGGRQMLSIHNISVSKPNVLFKNELKHQIYIGICLLLSFCCLKLPSYLLSAPANETLYTNYSRQIGEITFPFHHGVKQAKTMSSLL